MLCVLGILWIKLGQFCSNSSSVDSTCVVMVNSWQLYAYTDKHAQSLLNSSTDQTNPK